MGIAWEGSCPPVDTFGKNKTMQCRIFKPPNYRITNLTYYPKSLQKIRVKRSAKQAFTKVR